MKLKSWQPKRKKYTASISEVQPGSIASSQMWETERSNYTFHNIPLNIFIDQVCNETIDADISAQFFDAIKNKEQSHLLKIIKEINILESKYNLLTVAISYLTLLETIDIPRDPEVMAVLRLNLSIRDTDSLILIKTKSGRILSDLAVKKSEYERIKPKEDGGKIDRKYFSHLTLQVSKHLKYQVNKKETMAAEFADMVIDLRTAIEESRKPR